LVIVEGRSVVASLLDEPPFDEPPLGEPPFDEPPVPLAGATAPVLPPLLLLSLPSLLQATCKVTAVAANKIQSTKLGIRLSMGLVLSWMERV
jgi:hypothetical protein